MALKSAPRKPKAGDFFAGGLDMNSPVTLEKFRTASAAYTTKAVKTKASALKTLQREGILTKSGKLTKTYAARKA